MFWEVIAIVSLSLAVLFGGLDIVIRILDYRDRTRNNLAEYLKNKSAKAENKE